ncbi:hypothetical protein KCU83_g236, partial [Aureobasidium melanogenum]
MQTLHVRHLVLTRRIRRLGDHYLPRSCVKMLRDMPMYKSSLGITATTVCSASVYNSFFSAPPLLNACGSCSCFPVCTSGRLVASTYMATMASLDMEMTLAHAMPQSWMLMLPLGALGNARSHST